MRARDLSLSFNDGDLRATLEAHRAKMHEEVQKASEDYLLNTDIDEWVAYLTGEYAIEVPVLHAAQMELEDQGQVDVDVSHEWQMRAIIDPSQPAYVKGRRVLLRIPFTGDRAIFELRASTHSLNPPRAIIADGEIQLPIEYATDTERPDIKGTAQELVRKIEQGLEWARKDCEGHNRALEDEARRAIEHRRERVLADHAHLDDVGIPVRKRGDAPNTYQAPGVRRKPAPPDPRGKAGKPKKAEPTVVGDLYEHTVGLIRSWVKAIERTPGDYAKSGEEALRDALLIMLNTHYEGQGQAEAFNKSGKTDILIRIEDRNIFIAECKVWRGPKSFGEALGQLFGYATWRDTKLALICFVRQKVISAVVHKARGALEGHPELRAWKEARDGGELRCEMGWPGDSDRRAELTVFFVHVAGSV